MKEMYRRGSTAIQQLFSQNRNGRAALEARTALVDEIVQRLWNSTSPRPIPLELRLSPSEVMAAAVFTLTPTLTCCSSAKSRRRPTSRPRSARSPRSFGTRACGSAPPPRRSTTVHVSIQTSRIDHRPAGRPIHGRRGAARRTAHEHSAESNRARIASHARAIDRDHSDVRRNAPTPSSIWSRCKGLRGRAARYHLGCWAAMIHGLLKEGRWIDPNDSTPRLVARADGTRRDFLASVRCFLHYRSGRDNNELLMGRARRSRRARHRKRRCLFARRLDALLLPQCARSRSLRGTKWWSTPLRRTIPRQTNPELALACLQRRLHRGQRTRSPAAARRSTTPT